MECAEWLLLLLLFLAALLGGSCCLLFFHLLADFFLALGADLCPLGALGFNHLLAAQQFDVAVDAPSPARHPLWMMRRQPPLRSPKRGATVSNRRLTDSRVIR